MNNRNFGNGGDISFTRTFVSLRRRRVDGLRSQSRWMFWNEICYIIINSEEHIESLVGDLVVLQIHHLQCGCCEEIFDDEFHIIIINIAI